jgi:membrane protein YqaA with SNARE-associated domain
MRRLYDWALRLAGSPRATPGLFLLSFAESSFFPIPPDVMLVPMCISRRERAFRYALLCSIASVLGGIAGYAIGHFLWDQVGTFFFEHVPGVTQAGFDRIAGKYEQYNFWVVFTAGFTPIPYKLITISAGVFEIAFGIFVIASTVSRSARFFIEAWICHRYGAPAQAFIEKNFNLVAFAFVVLLVGGFWLVGKI